MHNTFVEASAKVFFSFNFCGLGEEEGGGGGDGVTDCQGYLFLLALIVVNLCSIPQLW